MHFEKQKRWKMRLISKLVDSDGCWATANANTGVTACDTGREEELGARARELKI